MQSLPTARQARDYFIDVMNRHAVAPERVGFQADVRSEDGLPNPMPNVAITGWCIVPHWVEDSADGPPPQRSEHCWVLHSGDGDSRLVIDHGDALVVAPCGAIYPLLQPAALGDVPAPQSPAVSVDIDHCDEDRIISVLLWGAESLVQAAEDRKAEESFIATAVPELMKMVDALRISPSLHRFYYCIPGEHPELLDGGVQFCEIRQQIVTRLPAPARPQIEGWVVKQRRPEGTFAPEFVVTPGGAIYCLDLGADDPAEAVLPEALAWPPDDLDRFEVAEFVAALEASLEWLPLERSAATG